MRFSFVEVNWSKEASTAKSMWDENEGVTRSRLDFRGDRLFLWTLVKYSSSVRLVSTKLDNYIPRPRSSWTMWNKVFSFKAAEKIEFELVQSIVNVSWWFDDLLASFLSLWRGGGRYVSFLYFSKRFENWLHWRVRLVVVLLSRRLCYSIWISIVINESRLLLLFLMCICQ